MVDEVKQAIKAKPDPATAFYSRGIFSSEFILIYSFCVGIFANYAWLGGRVPMEAIIFIGTWVGTYTGIRQVGKAMGTNPSNGQHKVNGGN